MLKKWKALAAVERVSIFAIFISVSAAGIMKGQESRIASPQGIRRMTLEQVKQQVATAANPIARLGQLSVEVARQHRLGVEADYFPKLGATFVNLHFSDFLGEVLTIRRPLNGTSTQVFVPLFNQNQTAVALTLTQPITPLFKVHQAVRIARADE